jgi:hypothetical protein
VNVLRRAALAALDRAALAALDRAALAALGRAALAALCLAFLACGPALATPFSDIPANHWAYQYIASLAADGIIDGYEDGEFKGDRPLTRYEMAVIVARTLDRLQRAGETQASKADLDKLQKLIDALKDELDSLGVRVDNVEDSLAALDRRTKFAQSLSLHGAFLPNVTFRERTVAPKSIPNTTGAPITTYYGATIPGGTGTPGGGAVGPVDPLVTAFATTDDSNDPLTQALAGIAIRQASRFSLAYQIDDNLTVSLPVRILNYEYGGEFTQQSKFDIEPSIDIGVAKAGALSNLDFTFGIIDTMTSSRTGLAFRAPQGDDGADPYTEDYQPWQKGVAVRGTVGEGAFGLTDIEASFTRVDDTLLDTQPGVTSPDVLPFGANTYFTPVVPPQAGATQTTPAAALRTDTFSAGDAGLGQAFLTQTAQNGSVYVSSYDGETFDAAGARTGGPALLGAAPGFTFNAAFNSVVFSQPLPPGSVVTITYRGLGLTNDTTFQRYMVHARANQRFAGYPGLQVGVTFDRIFDVDDQSGLNAPAPGITPIPAATVAGYGDVSDTVLGLDFESPLPVPFDLRRFGLQPAVYGEVAHSNYSPDLADAAVVGDSAAVAGVRFKLFKFQLAAQYQAVGANYFVGAPFQYYGNAPDTFAQYTNGYVPGFFGFANNVGINQQFDAQFTRAGVASPDTSGNPNLTFVFPIWNTLQASGPEYYSAFAPNSRGESLSANGPVRIAGYGFTATGAYRHLEEIRAGSPGALFFGPVYPTTAREHYDLYSAGATFVVPALGRRLTSHLTASYETLRRLDLTPAAYVPIDPGTQAADAAAFAAASALGGSRVSYYPNYVNARRIAISAAAGFPLTKDLTLDASYSLQSFGGSYGTTLAQNISERKGYYTGSLTYRIPNTNSSLSLLEQRYSYTDEVVPNANLGENRQDLNFTVRF